MVTKRETKVLLEVIPPRICVTFRRGSFRFGPETSKMQIWKPRPENTTNTVSGSRPDFSEKSENHENRLELDPYSTYRAENQAIWNLKVLWIQWDPPEPQSCHIKFKIGQKSNGSHRGQCTLNYSVNRMDQVSIGRSHQLPAHVSPQRQWQTC